MFLNWEITWFAGIYHCPRQTNDLWHLGSSSRIIVGHRLLFTAVNKRSCCFEKCVNHLSQQYLSFAFVSS